MDEDFNEVGDDDEDVTVQVNGVIKALKAASHALRSYQYGNSSPELAESVADACDEALKTVGEKA